MKDLGYLLFGIADGLILVIVFAGLTWAAIADGDDERAVRARLADLAPASGAQPALAAAGA